MAMDISRYLFIRMAKLAEPLMKDGGALFTMSYYGAEKVVENYNVMGPVKAALEASTRYLSAELGPKGIRVHSISPGPIQTRAASGIDRFDQLVTTAKGGFARSQPNARQHRGCRHGHGVPRHRLCQADYRRHHVYNGGDHVVS